MTIRIIVTDDDHPNVKHDWVAEVTDNEHALLKQLASGDASTDAMVDRLRYIDHDRGDTVMWRVADAVEGADLPVLAIETVEDPDTRSTQEQKAARSAIRKSLEQEPDMDWLKKRIAQ